MYFPEEKNLGPGGYGYVKGHILHAPILMPRNLRSPAPYVRDTII